MLCPNCRRQAGRKPAFCPHCGVPLDGRPPALELVLSDGTRLPLVEEVTIGRAPDNTVQLSDPSVSRRHARIAPSGNGARAPMLEDTGSSYGTWLDGRRLVGTGELRDGSRIRLGDQELVVDHPRGASEAGRTIVVPPGASLVPSRGHDADLSSRPAEFDDRPRLRSGYALKRLEADEGSLRWVLKDLRTGRIRHFSDADATLLRLLDGQRPLSELAPEAERLLGAGGPARLARLLAGLAGRGLLAGEPEADADAPQVRQARALLRPREISWTGAAKLFERLYARGGWLLFTRTAEVALASLAVVGVIVFGLLVVRRYGTPFVVAHKVGLGGLVFVLGRLALVAFHETAHGLAMASFGRRVQKAGLKVLLVFPYAYVDTSDIWFEPWRRRIAVSAAGPASDFVLGAVFSLCCAALGAGAMRDIFFQLAFAAYLGGLFNLNPMLERDGYHILVDVLREPGLRRRAREQLRASLSGRRNPGTSRVLARYALFSIVWTVGAATFTAVLSLRYRGPLTAVAPTPLAWSLLVALWLALLTPAVLMLAPPLRERLRARKT